MAQGLKDPNIQAYYDALFMMYGQPGWATILDDMNRMEEIYKSVDNVQDENELWFRKGQLDVIRQLQTHQTRTEHAYAEALAEDGADPEAPTGGVAKVVSDSARDEDPAPL